MGFSLIDSIRLHEAAFFDDVGSLPVASVISGSGRIISAVGFIAINTVLLPFDATIALGEIVFTDERMFRDRTVDDIKTIFYNVMQILHGAIDMIPVIGNVPYWLKPKYSPLQTVINAFLPLYSMGPRSVNVENSVVFYKGEFFEKGGLIPGLSTITGTCRIVSAVAAIVFNTIILPLDAVAALGEMMFTRDTRFRERMLDDVGTIFYHAMQIIHGAIDVIPVIGNIPYWIKSACKSEGEVAV